VTQYFQQEISPPQPERHLFIAREYSYHGATLGALDLSDFKIRKKIYRTILKDNMHTVPACHPFRNGSGMGEAEYVEWHKKKLIQKVKELGPERVAAFIVEPVVGAVSACPPLLFQLHVYERMDSMDRRFQNASSCRDRPSVVLQRYPDISRPCEKFATTMASYSSLMRLCVGWAVPVISTPGRRSKWFRTSNS
jgi:hypothetical protein